MRTPQKTVAIAGGKNRKEECPILALCAKIWIAQGRQKWHSIAMDSVRGLGRQEGNKQVPKKIPQETEKGNDSHLNQNDGVI